MKKFVFSALAIAFVAFSANAQEDGGLTSKKGEPILPEAEDIAIGFNGAPFLNYAGNMLTGGFNASPTANFINSDLSIVGKYFVDAETAYRGRIRLGMVNMKSEVLTDTAGALVGPNNIKDVYKVRNNNVTIGVGMEMRRGKTRIQGYYGGEVLVTMGGGVDTASVDYEVALGTTPTIGGMRTKSANQGNTFGLTARGFVGVEVFVFPKVSVGMEYGWGIGYTSVGEGERKTERWGLASTSATSPSLIEETWVTGKSSTFAIDTDNSGGQLNIIFHF